LIGAQIDLSAFKACVWTHCSLAKPEPVVITCEPRAAYKVVERAKLMGVAASKLGWSVATHWRSKPRRRIQLPLADLHDAWWHAIARLMA